MSILLRKECQESLDNAGLEKLHVGISNKTLCLMGECGQTIITISGIKFNSNTITTKEIKYTVELFNEFIKKHTAKIQDFIKTSETFKKLKEPIFEPKGNWAISYRELKYKLNGSQILTIKNNGKVKFHSYDHTIEEIREILDLIENTKSVNNYIAETINYNKIKENLNKAKAEIGSCNI